MVRKLREGVTLDTMLVLCILLIAGCTSSSDLPQVTPDETQPGSPVVGSEQVPTSGVLDPDRVGAAWAGSSHSSTFVVDDSGKNSECARCHAPVNWIPSMDDMPESCATCKFEVDPPPPFIDETDWTAIECKVCHELNKKGEVEEGFEWLEIAAIEEYAPVASPDELCAKCHVTEAFPGHVVVAVAGDHQGYGCTDCHDAHSGSASCSQVGCHPDLDQGEIISGHDQDHALVTCIACHDASGLPVDIDQEAGTWSTFLDEDMQRAFVSHNTGRGVDCGRCHFEGNRWNLNPAVE